MQALTRIAQAFRDFDDDDDDDDDDLDESWDSEYGSTGFFGQNVVSY